MASIKRSQVRVSPTHLASILTAGTRHPGDVWRTEGGQWRALNHNNVAKSFDDKARADAHAKGGAKKPPPKPHGNSDGHGEHDEHDEHDDHASPALKEVVSKFLDKMKELPSAAKEFVTSAPEKVKKFVVDSDHRKEVMSSVATSMKEGAKKIPELLKKATKEELDEIKTGVSAAKKLFKRPPEKLSKHEKKALYAVGAYVVSTAVAAASGGAALAAGGFGKAFLKHVGLKAVNQLLDAGFTHFEVAESAAHGLHHFQHVVNHLASASEQEDTLLYLRLAAESEKGDSASAEETLLAYVHAAVAEAMKKGLSDSDMEDILSSMGGGDSDDSDDEPKEEKKASLRGDLIRLASSNKSLRPYLLQILAPKPR